MPNLNSFFLLLWIFFWMNVYCDLFLVSSYVQLRGNSIKKSVVSYFNTRNSANYLEIHCNIMDKTLHWIQFIKNNHNFHKIAFDLNSLFVARESTVFRYWNRSLRNFEVESRNWPRPWQRRSKSVEWKIVEFPSSISDRQEKKKPKHVDLKIKLSSAKSSQSQISSKPPIHRTWNQTA